MINLEELKSKTFLGIVEDNVDPKKMGRCRIRVFNIFDSIALEDIPWASPFKDLNGNGVNIPDKGKILTVVFDSGNIYTPEYIYAQHYNANLKKKLEDVSESDYLSFKALIFDHKTQIYVNESEGLKLDHKFNVINIKEGSINLDLKDNTASLNLGCDVASQRSILGDHFLNWFDEFVENLLGVNAGPFLANLGAPVIPNPAMIQVLTKYKALKEPKFLSHHVNIVDNESVNKLDRVAIGQIGDNVKTTKAEIDKLVKEIKVEKVKFVPRSGQSTDVPNGDLTVPTDENGNPLPNTDNPEDQKISPSTHDDINKILDAMKKKGYVILDKKFEMNIVGIRYQYEGMNYSDSFIDRMYVIYKDESGNWVKGGPYAISTIPGAGLKDPKTGKYEPLKKFKKDKPSNTLVTRRPFLGTLMEAQYINQYKIGEFLGEKALKSVSKQKAYRDSEVDTQKINYSVRDEGNFGMHIHKGFPGGGKVSSYSEGCQIFKDKNSLDHFFSLLEKHIKEGNRSTFNYTLMLAKDVGL
jgi:hypothetical protein